MHRPYAIATNTSYPTYSRNLHLEIEEIALRKSQDLSSLDLRTIDQSYLQQPALDDTIRGHLALWSMGYCARMGIPIITTDHMSSDEFIEEAHAIDQKLITIETQQPNTTIAWARCLAMHIAQEKYGAKAIGLFEPEKILGIPWMREYANSVIQGDTDIAVLKRHDTIMRLTYPINQYWSERWTNYALNFFMGEKHVRDEEEGWYEYDLMGGMRIIGEKAYSLFENPATSSFLRQGEQYHQAYSHLMITPWQALQRGLSVTSREVVYMHPAIQTYLESDEGRKTRYNEKRKRQRDSILTEFARATKKTYMLEAFRRRSEAFVDTQTKFDERYIFTDLSMRK